MEIVDPTSPAPLLTAAEVSKMLNVSKSTVYILSVRGQLTHVRIMKKFLYRSSDVQEFLQKNTHLAIE